MDRRFKLLSWTGLIAVVYFAAATGPLGANDEPHASQKSRTHTITIEGMNFVPEKLTVSQGNVVIWTNKDFFPHTATARGGSFDSKDIAPQEAWRFTAKAKGAFPYICTLHPTMKATLIVEELR